MIRKTKKLEDRVTEVLRRLDQEYGTDMRCYLSHENAWQLLIATILSAQCTDARVNMVTPELFRQRAGFCGGRHQGTGTGNSLYRILSQQSKKYYRMLQDANGAL